MMFDGNTYQHLSLLIRACYQNKVVMTAASKLDATNLQQYGCTYVQAAVFAIALRYWEGYKTLVGRDAGVMEFTAFHSQLSTQFGPQAEAYQSELSHLASFVLAPLDAGFEPRPLVDMITRIYRQTVGNHIVQQATNEALMSGNYGELIRQTSAVNIAAGSVREPVDILSKRNARPAKIVPSGIEFFDAMLGGGFRAGNGYGVFAPSGGGKTTLAAQIATTMAAQGRKVALICTEQSADEPEFIDRFWSLVTRRPTTDFEGHDDDTKFPLELVSDKDRQIGEIVRQNVMFYDFSKHPGDMDEVRSIAAGMSGAPPDIILIDWAGSFAKQLIMAKHPLADNETNALKHIADECALISRENAIPVVVFHQLRPDCNNPMQQYDHTDSNMCKQFVFNLSYALVLHPRDENDVLVIRTTKGRWIARSEQMVVLRGALSRFEGVSGYRKGKGRWVKEEDMQKMPTERKGGVKDVSEWMM